MLHRGLQILSICRKQNFETAVNNVKVLNNYVHICRQLAIDKVLPPIDATASDVFGTLQKPKDEYQFIEGDEGDRKEEERMSKENFHQKKIDVEYAKQIKQLLKQRKLSEALSIIDGGNLVKPDAYVYGLLIGSCGKFGYTKKAFKLYNEMKKRGIKPRASIYTSLFNSCSQSPWKEDGLSRASHLLESLESSGYEPNIINYNAIIKAFGRCGDLATAFRVVDKMISKGIMPDSSTFAFLLQACASDQESGFRHAILVWDKMLSKRIKPSLYTYNLLLRCCKDCNSGEGIDIKMLSAWNNSIHLSEKDCPRTISSKTDFITIHAGNIEEICNSDIPEENSNTVNISKAKKEVTPKENEAKLDKEMVSDYQKMEGSKIIVTDGHSLVLASSPKDRLQCLGGFNRFLEHMASSGVEPDIKTFTQLLEVIPSTESAEQSLLMALEDSGLTADEEFYNMLIKKRTLRFDYLGARSVLQLMASARIDPNVMTFGILALGCTNKRESAKFIAEVKDAGFRINAEIIGGLMSGACYRWDIPHIIELMELCIKEEVRPNEKLLGHLKQFRSKLNKAVENSKDNPTKNKKFSMRAYNIYKMRLTSWLKEINLSEADEVHPWAQFRRHNKTDVRTKSELGDEK